MSFESIRQKLNNSGLRLTSKFDAKSVARNMSANKSLLAKYSIFGQRGAAITIANRMGRNPEYMSASALSRSGGQNYRYSGGYMPSLSGYSGVSSNMFSQNVNWSNSGAYNTGGTIGAIAGLGVVGFGIADKLGIFGSDETTNLAKQYDSYNPVDGSELGDAGLPEASSYGANFNSLYGSVEAYMKSDTMKPGALKKSANELTKSARNNLNDAKATFNILKQRQGIAMENQSKYQTECDEEKTNLGNAQNQLTSSQSILKSEKENRARADAILSQSDTQYKEACSNLTAKEAAKEKAQAGVSSCKQELASATSAEAQAQANYKAAEKAANDPNATPEEKQAAEAAKSRAKKALDEAQAKKQTAEKNLDVAEGQLKTAKIDVQAAKDQKKTALENIEKTKADQQKAVDNCRNAQERVEAMQEKCDTAQEAYDDSKRAYTIAESKIQDATGVITQCQEFESRMKTLEDNVKKAEKLEAKALKAATKADPKKAEEDKKKGASDSKSNGTVNPIDTKSIKISQIENQDKASLGRRRDEINRTYPNREVMPKDIKDELDRINQELGKKEQDYQSI